MMKPGVEVGAKGGVGGADAVAGPAGPTGASIEEFCKTHSITITGGGLAPMVNFVDAPFNAVAQRNLVSAGFASPTPTQAISWPLALEGRDLISVAKTGSGKTLGFLLPAFHRLQEHAIRPVQGVSAPKVVVMAPTRELATQIYDEACKFAPCLLYTSPSPRDRG